MTLIRVPICPSTHVKTYSFFIVISSYKYKSSWHIKLLPTAYLLLIHFLLTFPTDSLGGFSFKTVDGKKQVSTDGGETWSNFSGGAELLWTNPSPTSAFPAQTLSIDLSGYESVIVFCKSAASTTCPPVPVVVRKNDGNCIVLGITPKGTAGNYGYHDFSGIGTAYIGMSIRYANVTDDGITFTQGGFGSNSMSDTHCIPVYIYGLPVSVPTIDTAL